MLRNKLGIFRTPLEWYPPFTVLRLRINSIALSLGRIENHKREVALARHGAFNRTKDWIGNTTCFRTHIHHEIFMKPRESFGLEFRVGILLYRSLNSEPLPASVIFEKDFLRLLNNHIRSEERRVG